MIIINKTLASILFKTQGVKSFNKINKNYVHYIAILCHRINLKATKLQSSSIEVHQNVLNS